MTDVGNKMCTSYHMVVRYLVDNYVIDKEAAIALCKLPKYAKWIEDAMAFGSYTFYVGNKIADDQVLQEQEIQIEEYDCE